MVAHDAVNKTLICNILGINYSNIWMIKQGNGGITIIDLFNECGKFENIKVPEDHFLVLGDNRSNSWDGRYWPGSKFLHKKEIIGKAYFRFWPLSQVGFFNK